MRFFRKVHPVAPPEMRAGKLPHDLDEIAETKMETTADFAAAMGRLSGGIVLEEAHFLSDLASRVNSGCIVEVGSFRGKSSVALSHGAKLAGPDVMVHCIEPHSPFVGVYGGEFGPRDRREFYRAMLATTAYENTALINLSSENVVDTWTQSVAICFIDGDHTYDGVKNDWRCWSRHVAPGGYVVFDDAKNPKIGPAQLIEEILVETTGWERMQAPGKFVVLRRNVLDSEVSAVKDAPKKYLVACGEVTFAGGILRFERLAKSIAPMGHSLTFLELDGQGDTTLLQASNTISMDEALRQKWDATMVPGAGFSDSTIAKFKELQAPQFGLRVQHILNDMTRESQFKKVNQSFDPNLVIFNNAAWPEGSYTTFRGDQFHILEGGVDTNHFTSKDRSSDIGHEFVVGGQASKNAKPLISAIEQLPHTIKLRLFGTVPEDVREFGSNLEKQNRLEFVGVLNDAQLKKFYDETNAIVSTENFAGWSNMSAEAAASGVPLICTTAGTTAFSDHNKTALVLHDAEAATIAAAIQNILDDPDGARKRTSAARKIIEGYSWSSYSKTLLKLMDTHPESHYFRAPKIGLFGKWPLEDRFQGLDETLEMTKGKSVLDLGSAEGLVSLHCMKLGAASVTGFEIDPDRVKFARKLLSQAGYDAVSNFQTGNLKHWDDFVSEAGVNLSHQYDAVLYLGIHQHLASQQDRISTLTGAMQHARELFVIRTPMQFWESDDILKQASNLGWEPLHDILNEANKEYLGGVVAFVKKDPSSTSTTGDVS